MTIADITVAGYFADGDLLSTTSLDSCLQDDVAVVTF